MKHRHTPAIPLPPGIEHPRYDQPLCSRCGLCMGKAWPEEESLQSCVFNSGWLGNHEERLFGRRRNDRDPDELDFGISIRRFNARMKRPVAGAQWGGIVTTMAMRALESGLAEGVVTLHGTMLSPKAILATTAAGVLEARGNKPVLAPVLAALHTAWSRGIGKLLVIGAACHLHAVRDFQERHAYLKEVDIHTIGIPCTDNLEPAHLRYVLDLVSRSPGSIENLEFMQDYRVHIRHRNGKTEKIPFFCLPPEVLRPGLFSNSCMSCFDYINSLADITVGYFGAPFSQDQSLQWLLIRTAKGEKLFDLVAGDVEVSPETGSGDAIASVRSSMGSTLAPVADPGILQQRKTLPKTLGNLLCMLMAIKGPKGTEFARYSIHIHALRNLCFVAHRYPGRLEMLVPDHIRTLAENYDIETFLPRE